MNDMRFADVMQQERERLHREGQLPVDEAVRLAREVAEALAASALGSLAAFYLISWLAKQEWFYRSFGFAPDSIVPALLLFGLLSGVVTFWFSPVAHWWSRRYEYQADAFAAEVMNERGSLIGALRKLNEKNLSNLTPHPLYSGFYYSHPTLLERERALAGGLRVEG